MRGQLLVETTAAIIMARVKVHICMTYYLLYFALLKTNVTLVANSSRQNYQIHKKKPKQKGHHVAKYPADSINWLFITSSQAPN